MGTYDKAMVTGDFVLAGYGVGMLFDIAVDMLVCYVVEIFTC